MRDLRIDFCQFHTTRPFSYLICCVRSDATGDTGACSESFKMYLARPQLVRYSSFVHLCRNVSIPLDNFRRLAAGLRTCPILVLHERYPHLPSTNELLYRTMHCMVQIESMDSGAELEHRQYLTQRTQLPSESFLSVKLLSNQRF